jgi:hypothetical protein
MAKKMGSVLRLRADASGVPKRTLARKKTKTAENRLKSKKSRRESRRQRENAAFLYVWRDYTVYGQNDDTLSEKQLEQE